MIADDCGTIDPLLSLYADGMASPEEAQRVAAHLPDCDSCRESLAWMQATQRALAGRPVVRPPAELRARIAAAIAASSAAPISVASGVRPARSFALRPSYAAAASLTIFGLVGYSLLREHPAANVKNPVASSNQVAVLPPVEKPLPNIAPTLPNALIGPTLKRHSHSSVMPLPAKNSLVAVNPGDEEPSASPFKVKTPVITHRTVKTAEKPSSILAPVIKLHVSPVKKTVQPSPLMASTKAPTASVEIRKAPVVQPENKKPDTIEAAVPKQTPPAATIIAKPIVTQDPTARVASNHSDNPLAIVNDYARHLRTAEFKTKVGRSMNAIATIVPTIDQDKKAGVPITGGSF